MPLLTPEQEQAAREAGVAARQAAAGPVAPELGARAGGPLALYDTATGAPVDLDPVAAQKAIEEGRAGPLADARVNLVSPDGQFHSVAGADVHSALKAGYRLESTRESAVQDYLAANEGMLGSAKVAGGKLASEALLGIPELVYEKTADKDALAEWEALKEAHPIASGIGTVAGFGASLAAGGPLFKAAAEAGHIAEGAVRGGGALSTLGRAVARVGTEGAILSAPTAITEAALGDPKAAAEHLAWGLGGGAALGALGTAAKWGVRGVKSLAESGLEHYGLDLHAENPLKELSESQAFRSLMHSQDARGTKIAMQAEGGPNGVGRYVLDNKLLRNPGEKFEEYADRVGERRESVGQQIGSLYRELDAAGAKGPTAYDLAKRFDEDVINPLRRQATRAGEVRKLEAFRDQFLESSRLRLADRGVGEETEGLQKLLEFKADPERWGAANKEMREFVEGKIAQAQRGREMPLYDLWEQRKDLSSKIYQERKAAAMGELTPVDEQLDKFRRMLDDSITEHATGQLGEGRDFSREVSALNKDYSMLSKIKDIVDTSVVRELKNRNLSLSDMIAGHGAGVGLAIHSPFAMLAGLPAAMGHKYLRENGNALVARYADQLGTYFAHRAVAEGERSLERMPGILSKLAARTPSAELGTANGFRMLLGADAERRADVDNLDVAREKLLALSSDPKRQMALDELVGHLEKGAPTIAREYARQEQARLDYLQKALPPIPPPVPFQQPPKPSKAEARKFADILEVALDPHSLMGHLEKGTLRPAHVQAARDLWPATYQRMVDSAKAWGLQAKAKRMPYQGIRAVSLLVGVPLDSASQHAADYQATFAAPEPMKPNPPSGASIDVPAAEPTPAQRIQEM